jgi:hypothetical protein
MLQEQLVAEFRGSAMTVGLHPMQLGILACVEYATYSTQYVRQILDPASDYMP